MKVQADKVNEAIKYLKSKSITEMNNLIRATCVFVTGRIELKKAQYREKNNLNRNVGLRGNKEAETRSLLSLKEI